MINLSIDELKLVSKNRGIKDYENKSEEDLIKIHSEPKPKISISKNKIKEIKKKFSELRHMFSKSKINKFRKSLYEIKNHRNLSTPEIRETEKSLIELEKSLHDLKKYHSYDDNEYNKIRSVKRLFNQFDKDYYKPMKTINSLGNKRNSYIEYKTRGDKDENLSPKEYLDLIRPYLGDVINDHKTSMKVKVHLSDKVTDYETKF